MTGMPPKIHVLKSKWDGLPWHKVFFGEEHGEGQSFTFIVSLAYVYRLAEGNKLRIGESLITPQLGNPPKVINRTITARKSRTVSSKSKANSGRMGSPLGLERGYLLARPTGLPTKLETPVACVHWLQQSIFEGEPWADWCGHRECNSSLSVCFRSLPVAFPTHHSRLPKVRALRLPGRCQFCRWRATVKAGTKQGKAKV